MFYVFSTLTCDTLYHIYPADNHKRDISITDKKILIKGGHGVSQKKSFYTPMGVMTQVSDEDMELLQKDFHFQEHQKLGFITIEKRKAETEKVAASMNLLDKSRPLTPNDYEKSESENGKEVTMYKTSRKRRDI